jgi:hypothetical protein
VTAVDAGFPFADALGEGDLVARRQGD